MSTSSNKSQKSQVKTEWERQERDMRWRKVRMKDLRVRELLVCACLYVCKNVRHVCMYVCNVM